MSARVQCTGPAKPWRPPHPGRRLPALRSRVPRIVTGGASRDDRRIMTLASSPLLRRLPVAAGALLVGLLAASPAQATSERAQRLHSDRPGAERALRQAGE